jgi:hypothetical protein
MQQLETLEILRVSDDCEKHRWDSHVFWVVTLQEPATINLITLAYNK